MGPRAGLDGCGKSYLPLGFSPQTVQSVASCYTNCITSPTVEMIKHQKEMGTVQTYQLYTLKTPFCYYNKNISILLEYLDFKYIGFFIVYLHYYPFLYHISVYFSFSLKRRKRIRRNTNTSTNIGVTISMGKRKRKKKIRTRRKIKRT